VFIVFACSQGNKGDEQKELAWAELFQKLNKTNYDLQRAIKVATGLHNKFEGMAEEDASAKLQKSAGELLLAMEQGDTMVSELNFMCKYKKDKESREPLTLSLAQTWQAKAAKVVTDIIEHGKVVKSLVPSAKADGK
jgi:hypothetical protein